MKKSNRPTDLRREYWQAIASLEANPTAWPGVRAGWKAAATRARRKLEAMGEPLHGPARIVLIGDPDHTEKQAACVRRLTSRPAWKLADCERI